MTNEYNWRKELTEAGTPTKRSPYRIGTKSKCKYVELIPHFISEVEYDLRMNLLAEALYEGFQKQERDSDGASK